MKIRLETLTYLDTKAKEELEQNDGSDFFQNLLAKVKEDILGLSELEGKDISMRHIDSLIHDPKDEIWMHTPEELAKLILELDEQLHVNDEPSPFTSTRVSGLVVSELRAKATQPQKAQSQSQSQPQQTEPCEAIAAIHTIIENIRSGPTSITIS